MYSYGRGFSFSVTLALSDASVEHDEGGVERPPATMQAWEHLWAIETLALLRIGGQFFVSIPEAALLRVDIELRGLMHATPWQATQGTYLLSPPKVKENLYTQGGVFSARQLAEDPREAVRQLLDPFMVAILPEGFDVVDWIGTPH
jgi:hypothetical protein